MRIPKPFAFVLSIPPLAGLLICCVAPAAAPAQDAHPSGFADHDGVRIYYEVEGNGPPLVLVHWATGSTADWRMFGYVDALKENYQLIMVDMRGHGRSDKPQDPAAYAAEVQAGDIVAVLDRLGIDKAHYFGYSLGARLGWALAKYAPERFHSLIIGGDIPTIWDDSAWEAQVLGGGAEKLAHNVEDYAKVMDVWHPDIFSTYASVDVDAVALASRGLNSEDLSTALATIDVPVLLLVGAKEAFYPDMISLTKLLPNATVAAMPDLDHAQGFMLSEQALPHITGFLTQVGQQ